MQSANNIREYLAKKLDSDSSQYNTIKFFEEIISEIKKQKPKYLYKYRGELDENTKKNLVSYKIWASSPNFFNDPYDCSFTINVPVLEKIREALLQLERLNENKNLSNYKYESTIVKICISENKHYLENSNTFEEFTDKLMELLSSKIPIFEYEGVRDSFKQKLCCIHSDSDKIKRVSDKIKNNYYISCLSEQKYSILMWSHYADNHKGFLIEYETSDIVGNLFPVIYTDKIYDISDVMRHADDAYGNSYYPTCYYAQAIRKFEDWQYEREWRIIERNENQEPKNGTEISTGKPKSIYLGSKISIEDRLFLTDFAKKNNIRIFQVKMNYKKYELSAEEI